TMNDVRLLFLLLLMSIQMNRGSAQESMIGDFFNSALSVFKPLVEERRTHIREDSTFIRPMLDSQRDQKVLGAPSRTPLQGATAPICNGDSKLCSFIACQAENFKNDQSFANINLAAQVLADKKLRHSVGDNPDAINAVCEDSGMDSSRCGTFTRGFQTIAKLINSLEGPVEKLQQRLPTAPSMQSGGLDGGLMPLEPTGMQPLPSPRLHQPLAGAPLTRFSALPGVQRTVWRGANSWGTSVTRTSPTHAVTIQRFTTANNGQRPIILANEPMQDEGVFGQAPIIRRLDDYDFSWAAPRGMPSINIPSPSSSSSLPSSPSSSWSSSSRQTAWNSDPPSRAFGSQTWSSNGDAIRPLSDNPLERNDLLASFTPLPPTAAPLAFPTVKSVLPSMDDLLLQPFRIDPAFEKMLMPLKIEPILRHRRHTDDFVRVVEHLARSTSKIDRGLAAVVDEDDEVKRVKRADDYYDQADAEDNARPSRPSSRAGSRRPGSSNGGAHDTGATEYYDEVDTAKESRHRNSRPGRPKTQRNCFELLG
ncbi:hypothetical protein PFISCL1PPCAC_22746, partial [Pristionchus fissidentatus]